MKKNAQTRRREWQTLFSAPTWQILKLEGLKWQPYLADYKDVLSLQWVTVVQKICPTDWLWVFWLAQLVALQTVVNLCALVEKKTGKKVDGVTREPSALPSGGTRA